jgi:hypothetical protein
VHEKVLIENLHSLAGLLLCTSVILTTQEAEIRRIVVQSQPRQIVPHNLISKEKKKPSQKRAGEWLKV